MHSRFATYPDVSCRSWTHIWGLEVPCPFLLDEWDAAAIGLEPIFQDPKSCVLQQQRSWCFTHRPQVHRWIRTIPDGFADHSDHQILRTKMDSVRAPRTPADFQSAATTESAYCPFLPDHSDDWKQDTKNSMIKSHGAIGWNCCMCPTARWIGFEPIISAFGKQFWYFCC